MKRARIPEPQKNTWRSRLIAWGDRLLEHSRLLLILVGAALMLLGTVFNSAIDYEDTIPVTAHYEQYSMHGRKRGAPTIKLYFTDHEPLSFGYKSTSREMQAQIKLIRRAKNSLCAYTPSPTRSCPSQRTIGPISPSSRAVAGAPRFNFPVGSGCV